MPNRILDSEQLARSFVQNFQCVIVSNASTICLHLKVQQGIVDFRFIGKISASDLFQFGAIRVWKPLLDVLFLDSIVFAATLASFRNRLGKIGLRSSVSFACVVLFSFLFLLYEQ